MSLPIQIQDGSSDNRARVTSNGELIVAPYDYSTIKYFALTSINVAYNFATPLPGKKGVITSIIMASSKDPTVNGALVEIYTANSSTSTSVINGVLTLQIAKNDSIVLTGLNWILPEGQWLNARSDTATIYLTICGFYIGV